MAKWFVVQSGREFGPVTSSQLKQMAATGQVQPDTLVRREDKQVAGAAGKVNGLFAVPPPQSQPPPLTTKTPDPVPPPAPAQSSNNPQWTVVSAICGGLVFFCCGGICCSGALFSGGGNAPPVKTEFKTEEEFRRLVMGKSTDEVIAAVGKPGDINPSGRFTNGETYDESWVYYRCLTHKATGKKQNVVVFFTDDRVVETSVR